MRKISESTVRRLCGYLRLLEEFQRAGKTTVSSDELALRGHTTPAQVRKDLSFFGSFGKRGLGYDVCDLTERLRDIMGLDKNYRVALIGAGKIGSALVQYRGFSDRGFDIVSVYDNDETKVGTSWGDVAVRHVSALESDLAVAPIQIAIIATPASEAQATLDRLVQLGIKAVLNFAPTQLDHPADVTVQNVNMAVELETLSYALRSCG
ncbi:MAG: redox-sensing transcriptional repressor Rex [Gemmatimonadota bacterium]|nr:MAG: redox-sensing transcriptional repressor Rex [Gemmatimonadota bacterium]